MSEKKNVPKLRFPGFTEPWEQRKLGDVATFINGRAYSQDELLDEGKYKVLRVGNFYTNDSWYYSNLELADKYYAEEGDLLYTWSATFGPHIWHGNKVIYHYHIWKVELSDKLNKSFVLQLLEEDKANILANKNGSTMVHITKDGMEQKQISIPSNVQEQAQIGAYFEQLDNLITLHQRKLEHIKDLKKCMLQKMFPKSEQLYPEIRFPEFTDAWEQRKFGDITESYSGGTPTAGRKEYYDGDIPFIRSGEISSDKTELFLSEDGLNNSSAKMVKIGDILYALYGATSGEVSISKLDGAINQAILAIKPYPNYDSQFLMQWLRKSKETIIGTYLQGGQGNLSGNIVKDLLIDMPTYNEQKQIGTYFERLDNLITLHQRELDHLKLLKKGMLQQLFI